MSSETIQLTIPGALVSIQAAQEPGTLIADRSGWQRAVLRAALPSAAKLVACTLASHVADAPSTVPAGAAVSGPGLITLMEQTGYSRTHVQRQVSRLRRQGWLTTVARPAAGRTTRFALTIPDAAVRDGLVRLVESPDTVLASNSAASGSARRRGRRGRAGSHTRSTARRRTRAMATVGSDAPSASGGSAGRGGDGGGFVVDLVPSRRGQDQDGQTHPSPGDQPVPTPEPSVGADRASGSVTVDSPVAPASPPAATPTQASPPVQPAAPAQPTARAAAPASPATSGVPAAPTPAATGSGADAHGSTWSGSTWSGSTWSGAADESRAGDRAADPRPAQPSAAQPHITDQQAAEPQAAEPQAAEPRAAGERDEEVDDPTAPTVPLPPPPPKPMTLAATQVINVLANAMRRPTSDYLEIFGKLQVIFDEDNWDPVTLALHLVHIISTGVLVGDGDEIDNLSWRLDRLPRSSAECECRSCLEQRGEKLGARPAPGTRRFARPGAGRSTGAGGGSKPATGSGQATRAADMDMSDPRPVEIPRPPLEAIERAAQAAREARARERAADGAA